MSRMLVALLVLVLVTGDGAAFYRANLAQAGGAVTVAGALTANVGIQVGNGYGIALNGEAIPATETVTGNGDYLTLGTGAKLAKLGVGGAVPTYSGCVKLYPNFDDGNVIGLGFDKTGTDTANDYFVEYDGYGGFSSQAVNTATYLIASGAVATNTIYNQLNNGAPSFTYGVTIADNYGIGMGGKSAPASDTITGATNVYADNLKSSTGLAAPTLTYGFIAPAMATPAAPAAGSVHVYVDDTNKVLQNITSIADSIISTEVLP